MILALDSNVLIDLWNGTSRGQANATRLALIQERGDTLTVCGAVYAGLHAHPGLTPAHLEAELAQMGIAPDFFVGGVIWQEVGRAHADAASAIGEPAAPAAPGRSSDRRARPAPCWCSVDPERHRLQRLSLPPVNSALKSCRNPGWGLLVTPTTSAQNLS